MSKILLKGGEIATLEGALAGDVLIENGKISKIGEELDSKDAEVIDCKGKMIFPGLIDVHVHLREPGHAYKEDWVTGSSAAVAGGVTTVFDMPNNNPPIVTLEDLVAKRKLIEGRSYCNYGLYIGFNGKNLSDINEAKNIPAVKFYACDSTGDMGVTESEAVTELFEKSNKRIVVHAEDADCLKENYKTLVDELGSLMDNFDPKEMGPENHSVIRSPECAALAVKRVCELAKKTGARLHIAHLSTEAELEIVNEYPEVTCEVAPHHLILSEDDYEYLGNLIRVNPPVRERSDIFAMWKGLKFGEIDIIATDHAPHTLVEKEQPYIDAPSGIPELDTLGPIMFNAVNDEGLSIEELVRICCARPAEIFGIKGKGQILEGYDADLVVVDMELEREVENDKLFTKCGWSPYADSMFKGWPVMTFVNGELVFKDEKIVGEKVGKEVNFT
ncbi:dihydroorotase [Candidatus Peregrinibacteria bacterium]|nr:dihydroorotase [Candidatus Peregrinibacteria bacterium]